MPQRDRRSEPRHPAAAVPARLRPNHPLRLLDLSASGARVETLEWMAPGRRYSFRLGPERHLQLAGHVTRCALVRLDDDADGGRAVFEAAIALDAVAAVDRARLRVLLETGSVRGSESWQAPRLAAGA